MNVILLLGQKNGSIVKYIANYIGRIQQLSERYKLYNYAMPEYETLIIDTKTNNFVKYNKLLEIINHSDISEFVKEEKEELKTIHDIWEEKGDLNRHQKFAIITGYLEKQIEKWEEKRDE